MTQTYYTLIYVYPDGDSFIKPFSWKSEEYEQRYTTVCKECDTFLSIHYGEPFASCKCGTQEWYK
jgi:hypothetical protein